MNLGRKAAALALALAVALLVARPASAAAPGLSAQCAILLDASSGRVLYEKDAHVERAMASLTKVMTALVVVENSKLDEVVTVSEAATKVEASNVWLEPGEQQTVESLLYGLLLRSGNDASLALAEHVGGGDVDKFYEMMNATARRIGANDSHFANPHGLDAEGHFTTAYDMALICREALKYDAINTIIKTERYLMPWPNHDYPRLITNHNSLVLPYSGVLYEGADGIKTGFTRKAGRCLAASATRGDMRLIAIVLNDGNDWRDCSAMFDWGFKTFKPLPLAKKGEALRTILVSHGDSESVTAVCEGDVYWPTAAGEDSAQLVLKSPESLSAPIKQGDQVGTAELVWKGEVVNSFRLVAQNDVNLTGWRAIWRDVVNGWHRVWPFVFSRPGRAKSDD